MARTTEEIKQAMQTDFVANPYLQELYELDPGQTFDQQFSKVSLEALIISVVAYAIFTLEKLFDIHKEWIENRALELEPGNLRWYKKKALDFQYGDAIVWDGKEYSYPEINEENKIVKLASATEGDGFVLIKTAKLSGTTPEQLDSDELNALKTYMKQVKYAGVKVLVVSRPSDKLKIYYRIYLDSLVFNPDGSLILEPSVKPVEDAITNYCKNIRFDGVFVVTDLTDVLQKIDGVINPVFESAEAKYSLVPYAPIQDYYKSNAGYLEIDEDFLLVDTIEYIMS